MPRKRKNAPPPWWSAPLQEWFREARLALISNGHPDDAEELRLLMRTRDQEINRLKEVARLRLLAGERGKQGGRTSGRFDAVEAQRARGDGIAKLMSSFLRAGTPAVTPTTDFWRAPFKQPSPDRVELLRPVLQAEQRRRAIIDDLPEDKRRQICAAAGVIWVAYHAHKHPTRLERGGPRDLNHPGDSVEIGRTMVHDAVESHALAVAGKTLVAMEAFYGKPRFVLNGSLVRFFTGEEVSVDKQFELWARIRPPGRRPSRTR
jgi:hypothetical protein